ncbi:MAG: glycosyltransferase, partial [Chloroflexi bacterium]|nr:glycosyltransferase [Chloroflexota bacterium]
MTQVAILGAGMAGLSAGWLLKQKGVDFIVFEKQPYVGGLARSFLWNGFYCDFATHRLFTTDEVILHELLKLVPMGRHIRRSKIYIRGHWLRDPLDVLELGTHLPIAERFKVLWTYFTRPKNLPEDSFENYVLMRYGRGLYDIFFRPYTEKLFGIPGKEISVLWARQKVRLANPLDSWRENTKTKFQYFYYPVREGYGAITDKLYEEIQDHVMIGTTVRGLEKNGSKISAIIYEKDEQEFREPIEAVISTLPLTTTGRMLGHTFNLKYRKVDSVYLHINRPLMANYHWIYFMDEDVSINRLAEFKNLSAVDAPEATSVICAEVTQDHEDVIGKAVDDLIRVGLVTRDDILDTKSVREEFSYPVYDETYDKVLDDAMVNLGQYQNLFVVGRAAEFKHRETDDNFAAAAETITQVIQDISIKSRIEHEVEEMMTPATMKPEVRKGSVYAIVLAWNNYEDTKECLETVTALDTAILKIVLVDNGSTDQTPEKVREQFPGVHVIENGRNLGVPAGYNIGFSYALEAGAEYILMLNNDIAVPPDMLT